MATKILIADDNVLIRRGLRALLQTHDGWEEENSELPVESRAPMAGYSPLTRQACFLVPLRDVHALHNEPQAK